MTHKFLCKDCLRSTFALANPISCPHCGGTMDLVDSAYVPTDTPEALSYERGISTEDMVEKFLNDFDDWWRE